MSKPIKNDIRFNNGIKTQAVRMRATGVYEYGHWLDGHFTLEGVTADVEKAMIAASMHQKPAVDNRPSFRR